MYNYLHAVNLLSIEIGGSKLQLVIGTANGTILQRFRFVVNREAGGEGIRAKIAEELPAIIDRWHPVAIGVGYGGPVEWETGLTRCSHQLTGWKNFHLGDWLHSITNVPVFVDNDANVAALGEALYGAGVGKSPVFWVNCGSGVGGGLIVNGQIYHGAAPGEMEIGHVHLDNRSGVVEDRCSGWAVDTAVRRASQNDPESILGRLVKERLSGGESRMLVHALIRECPVADLVLTTAMENLALALSHVVHLLNPAIIVVGGGLSLIGEPLRHRLEQALRRFIMAAFDVPPVALAKLGEDAVPIGGIALALSRLKNQPAAGGQMAHPDCDESRSGAGKNPISVSLGR